MLSRLRKDWTIPVLCLILVIAGFMRLFDVNFDQGTSQHPDERTMIDRALGHVTIPQGTPLDILLNPATSPLNPRQGTHYPYGALPLYLVKAVSTVGGSWLHQPSWWDWSGIQIIGRTMSGIFDLITVLLVFLIARRLYGRWAALLAAAFSAFTVMQIQIAHFFIVEPYLVTFLTAALYFSVILMQTRRAWAAALAGLMLGFALACKVSVVAVAVLIVAAVVLRVVYRARTRQLGPPAELDDPYGLEPASRRERTSPTRAASLIALRLLILAGVMTAVGFAIGDPFGLFDSGLHVGLGSDVANVSGGSISLGPLHFTAESNKYFDQLLQEAAVQSGSADVPYTTQFVGDMPVLYNVWQLVQFGMGPASGIVAILGLLLALWLAIRRRAAEILLLSGLIPYFLTIVNLEAKWPRYVLPIVPYLCILAGALLARGIEWSRAAAPRIAAWRTRRASVPAGLRLRRWSFPILAGLAVLGSLLWATAFMNIYTHPESRVLASHWINTHLPPGVAIGHETWDDALPIGLPGDPNGGWSGVDMGLYDFHPGPEEFDTIANWLQQADYIIPSSNRVYGSIIHEPWRYPVQMRYYDLLFSGKLGFEQVLPEEDQKVYPEIFGIKINDDSADESFTVYDHPHVYVFKKVRSLSVDELRTLFGASINIPSVNIRHLQIHTPRDYDKTLMMAQPPGQQLALDDYAWNPLAQNQWVAVVLWFLAIEVLGLLAWPITALVCRRLPDRGYPLSKTLALVLVTWLVWMAASLGLIPFTVYSILGAIVILAVAAYLLWRRFAPELRPWMAAHRRLILGWEALFTVAFIAFLIIRMLDPDLWQPWNGGEKPMEFGFLNSILRSPWMPPGDPFFSGGYINYYYYGWVGLGVLIKLLGIDSAVGFNLSIPLLFGLTVLGGASIVYNCIATVQRARGWRPAVSATAFGWGALGAVLLAVIGNLTFLLQFISMKAPNLQQALVDFIRARGGQIPAGSPILHSYAGGFDYWGARSVIDNTINEWPYWTFLFADLHPHLIDMSYSVLALGLIFNLVLGAWRWPLAAPLPATFTEAPVPPVPAPGVLTQPTGRPLWRATVEATVRLWGSSWGDALFRFLITALCLGILFAVNSWDFPVYLVVAAGALFVTVLLAYQAHAVRRSAIRLGTAIAALVGLVLAAVIGLGFYAPFILSFKPFYNQIKFITDDTLATLGGQRTGLPEFLSIWGLFVFVSLSYLALQLWKYPWAQSFRGLSDLVTGRAPRPAPALALPTPAASTAADLDLEMSRFRPAQAAPAEATALAPVSVIAEVPSGNGHAEAEATPLVAPAPPAEEWEEYGLADIGALDLELDEAELARQRRTRTAVVPSGAGTNGHGDGPALSGNGHDADLGDYDYADVPPFEPQMILESAPLVEAPPVQAHEPANGLDNLSVSDLPPGEELPATVETADALATAPSTNGHALESTLVDSEDLVPLPAANGYVGESVVEEAPTLSTQHSALSTRLPGLLWPAVGAVLMLLTVLGSAFMVLRHEGLSALLILLVGGLIATHLGAVRNPGQLLGGLLMAAGWGIALGVEYVYLADHLAGGSAFRMNTVFKFYEQVWVLVACGTAIALYAMLGPRGRGSVAAQPAASIASVLDASPTAPGVTDMAPDAGTEPAPLTASAEETSSDETALYMRPASPLEIAEVSSATGEALIPDTVQASAEAPDQAPAAVVASAATDAAPSEPTLTAHDPADIADTPLADTAADPAADDGAPTQRTLEYTLAPVASGATGRSDWFSFPRLIWLVPFAVLFLGSLIFTISGTQARVADRMPSESARPSGTLNGMDWMDKTTLTLSFDDGASGPIIYKFEREALDWMNTHIKGTPVVAAAPREYYRQSGMLVGTYTGLPMVVGGLHQDEQRYDWEVGERRGDMDTFFRNPDIPTALLLINKYDIDYIYLGQIETVGYQADAAGLAKFKEMEGTYLEVAYKNDLVTVYHVLRPKVQADMGAAPGTVRPAATPRPVPTDVPLGDDPTLKSLQAAVDADPNNVDARRALGEYYRAHNAPQKAIEQYAAVAQLAPQDVAAHHILGDLYQDNGQPDQALAAWEDALKNAKDADKPAAYNKVGIAYQQRQRFDDAVNAFTGAVKADPHFAEAWFHLGETYQMMQNVDAARDAYQNCIKNAPNDDSGKSWAQNAQKALDSLH